MSLISKLAWIALPALAGCGMMTQVASQGTGANRLTAPSLNSSAKQIFQQFGIEPFFTEQRAFEDWKPYSDEYRKKHLTNNGSALTWEEVEGLKKAATLMAYNDPSVQHVAGRDWKKTPALLTIALDKLLADNGYTGISKDMRGIMELRASSAWTRKTMQYLELPNRRAQGAALKAVNMQALFDQQNPPAICTDSAAVSRSIAREMAKLSGSGLKAYFVEGSVLWPSETRNGQGLGHAWVGGILASGMKMPSDPTPKDLETQKRTDWSKAPMQFTDCPTDQVSAELFMASYCDKNDMDSWKRNEQRVASGGKDFPPREGIDIRQGDKQIMVNLGNNRGNATGHWRRWLEQDQPYRSRLIPLEKWYSER